MYRAAKLAGRDPLVELGLTGPMTQERALFLMRLEHPDVDQKMRDGTGEAELLEAQRIEEMWDDALPGGSGYRGSRGGKAG